MRISIDFYVNMDIHFYSPLNEAMTAFIYRMIRSVDRDYGERLHEQGYANMGYKKFVYHSYAFIQNNQIVKHDLKKGKATLIFSSVLDKTVIDFVKGISRCSNIQLFGYSFNILNIKYIPDPQLGASDCFRILSPICGLGAGYVWLDEKATEQKVADNLIEKYYALHSQLPANVDIRVKLLNSKSEYIQYKKIKYKGYTGIAIIEGDKDIVKLAYQAGLGPKCGIGMGLLGK